MTRAAEYFFGIFLLSMWLVGIAIAKGFWQTLFTFFPPYAYYVVVEWILRSKNLI